MSADRRAILFMCAGMSFLAANDAIVKLVGADLPVGQILVLRGLVLIAVLAAGLLLNGERIRIGPLTHRWSVLRGAGEIAATYLFLSSLAHAPIAIATTLVFIAPVILTAVSGPLFAERVGPWRWGAVAAGFLGVMTVTAPWDEAWEPALLLPLGAGAMVAFRDVATRFVSEEISTGSVTLTSAIMVTIGGLASIPFGWAPVSPTHVGWTTLAGAIIAASFFFYVVAIRTGQLSLIAPVQYVVIPWASFYGAVFWGEHPDGRALAGGALIVGSGLLILRRERINRLRQTAAKPAAPDDPPAAP